MVTDPQTQTHTHLQTNPQTGPITIHCAAKLSAQCNEQNLFAVGVAALSQIPSLSLGTRAPVSVAVTNIG